MTGGSSPSRNSARDAVEQWGYGGGSTLFLRWGKLSGRSLGSIIGVRVQAHAERCTKSNPISDLSFERTSN
jgi:hypothetical protein